MLRQHHLALHSLRRAACLRLVVQQHQGHLSPAADSLYRPGQANQLNLVNKKKPVILRGQVHRPPQHPDPALRREAHQWVGLVRVCPPSPLLRKTRMKTKKMRKPLLRLVLAGHLVRLSPAKDQAHQQVS